MVAMPSGPKGLLDMQACLKTLDASQAVRASERVTGKAWISGVSEVVTKGSR